MVADIIIPLTADPNGPTAHVWIEAVETTRQGSKPTPGMGDRWRLGLPLRASLGMGAQLLLDSAGREIPTCVPPCLCNGGDLADYIHHSEIVEHMMRERDLCLRIVTGDIKPLPQESPQ